METDASATQATQGAVTIHWEDIQRETRLLLDRNRKPRVERTWGVPVGGCFVAQVLALQYGIVQLEVLPEGGGEDVLVVDDVVDSGKTLAPYQAAGMRVDALYRKPYSPKDLAPSARECAGWVKFPWDHSQEPEDSVRRLIEWIGENPEREGLTETPKRYLKAVNELTSGYKEDPAKILSAVFEERYDQMVVVRDIEFWSLCEHHLLPFRGTATVGYLPNGRVLGLSKIPRLVRSFSQRLQVQERLTTEIAEALEAVLKPLGVGVLVRANHTCMQMRGVRSTGEMVTSCLLGAMRDSAREEFLLLAAKKGPQA